MPNILDRYIAAIYLRSAALSFAALLGLFYIGTFIDKTDKLFKGQATTRHGVAAARVHDAAVHLLRHPAGGAARRAGDLRPAQPIERAVGDEGLRHQPLSDRRAAPAPVARVERRSCTASSSGSWRGRTRRRRRWTRGSGARRRGRRIPCQPALGGGARRGDLSLHVFRPAEERAPEPRDLPAGEGRLAARKPASSPAARSFDGQQWTAPAGWQQDFAGKRHDGPRSPSRTLPTRAARLLRDAAADRRDDDGAAAETLHRRALRQRLQRRPAHHRAAEETRLPAS